MRSILQLTDMHIFEDRERTMFTMDTKQTFVEVCRLAKASAVAFDCVLLTGDLADNAEPESYRWLAQQVEQFELPVYAIPGNHDDADLITEYFPTPGTLSFDQWQVVFLNSCIDGATAGRMCDNNLRHLDDCLQSNAHPYNLVVLHHQPVAVGSSWMDGMGLKNADAFWQVIDRRDNGANNITAVLWGHVHQNFDSYRNSTRLIGSPSTCTQFVPGATRFTLDSKGPAYRHLVLRDDGVIDTEVVRV